MERRFLAADTAHVEAREDAQGRISGYAAVFYDGTPGTEFELYAGARERIVPGAFAEALNRDDVRALFNHDANEVLGRNKAGTLRLFEDNRGLRYEIEPGETTTYQNVREYIRRGDVTGSSFAFIVKDESYRKENGVRIREIRGVELYDVGPVTYPAYAASSTGLRSVSGIEEARAAFDALDAKEDAERRRRVAIGARARLVD